MKGMFLSLEGGEGAGKSSLLQYLHAWFVSRGRQCCVSREPGGTPLGEQLRELLLDERCSGISAQAELLLFLAARLEHVRQCIIPKLQQGMVVLCDRYIDSTVAYQAYGRHLCPDEVWSMAVDIVPLLPTCTIYLDVPVPVSSQRLAARNKRPDRLEQESLAFYERVREGFLALAQKHTERIIVVDAQQPEAVVQQLVTTMLEARCFVCT